MSLLKVLRYPHPQLRTHCPEIEQFSSEIGDRARDMIETMYAAPGVGLAAPQVGWEVRLFVADVDYRIIYPEEDLPTPPIYEKKNPLIFINPKIIETAGSFSYEEGCLSFPGVYEKITRSKSVTMTYYDLKGNRKEIQAKGNLLSVCLQHELDHLNGKLFLDLMPETKRLIIDEKFSTGKKS